MGILLVIPISMATLQEVFVRMREKQKEQRELKKVYRDALASQKEYENVLDEFDKIKTHKKAIEADVKSELFQEFERLEKLKLDIASDKELLADLAVNTYVKGETVIVRDEHEQEYEPMFSVKFTRKV